MKQENLKVTSVCCKTRIITTKKRLDYGKIHERIQGVRGQRERG